MNTPLTDPKHGPIERVLAAIRSIRKAFGPPGDYGYDSKEGKALFEAFEAHNALADLYERSGVGFIAAERQRQISSEGYSPEHDDEHKDGELAEAAACYSAQYQDARLSVPPDGWPWGPEWWKPTSGNRIRELAKAGALIAAEIDRLQRAKSREAAK